MSTSGIDTQQESHSTNGSKLIYAFTISFFIFTLWNVFVMFYVYGKNGELEIRTAIKGVDSNMTIRKESYFKTGIDSKLTSTKEPYLKDSIDSNITPTKDSFFSTRVDSKIASTKASYLKTHLDSKITSSKAPYFKTNINFNWLENNPIYKRFYVESSPVKKRVTLLVIVSTAPKKVDRRNAIRSTWWTQCVKTKDVTPECIFITDYQGPNDEFFHHVREEKKRYGDLHFQLVRGGVTFGHRFINHMLFAVQNYNFDYLIRMDDDIFVCFEKLLHELPMPRLPLFHWGWIHTVIRYIVRPDEFFLLLSRDTVELFLLQDPSKMYCHPLADQMIATWITQLNVTSLLRHDQRIHHDPPVRDIPDLMSGKDLCNTWMAFHGAYPESMTNLWSRRGSNVAIKGNLQTNSQSVSTSEPFNWRTFGEKWQYEPKLCIGNPTWDTSQLLKTGSSYVGREGTR